MMRKALLQVLAEALSIFPVICFNAADLRNFVANNFKTGDTKMRMFESADENPDASFDQNLANSYIGKNLLFGTTFCDYDENVLGQEQNYGEIIEINARVIVVKIHDSNENFTLPPFVNELESAPEGEYRLRSTGEIVVNPDLLGRFQFIAPAPKAQEQD